MGAVQSVECERARAWVSLELDGELSEVEGALLRAHVGRCAACADFARDVDALTQEIRTARPQRPAVTRVSSHSRRAATRRLRLGAAAAAVVAVAAGFGSLAGSLTSPSPPPPHAGAGRSIAL
jgi:predicted anti-sigma-YlaC factor YlaD